MYGHRPSGPRWRSRGAALFLGADDLRELGVDPDEAERVAYAIREGTLHLWPVTVDADDKSKQEQIAPLEAPLISGEKERGGGPRLAQSAVRRVPPRRFRR